MKAELRTSLAEVFDYPDEAVRAYTDHGPALLKFVNHKLENRTDILRLIGNNPLSMMENNHKNHMDFMSSVLEYHQYKVLSDTLPWVYHTYLSKGFDADYFQLELES